MIKKVKLGEVVGDLTEERKIIIDNDENILEPTINTKEHKINVRRIINGSELKIKNRILIKKGDLVFSKLHTQNGSFAISDSEYKSTTTFLPLKIKEDLILKDYLFWILHLLVPNLRTSDTVGRETYKTEDILNIEFILPTLIEQKKIIEKILGSKIKIDKLYLNIEHQSDFLKSLRQSILQEAVSGKLVPQDPKDEPASELLKKIKAEKKKLIEEGKIRKDKLLPPISKDELPYGLPKGWEWVKLGQIYTILRGSSPRPKGDRRFFSEKNTNYNWITISDITNFTKESILYKTKEFLTSEGSLRSTFVKKDEVIIAVSGSTTGKSCITGINGYIYDGLAVFRKITTHIDNPYFYLFIKQLYNYLNNSKEGSAFPNINTEKLKNILFPLPPLPEQKRIVEKVDQLMKLCDELEEKVKENQKNSELLMEAVLREAFET